MYLFSNKFFFLFINKRRPCFGRNSVVLYFELPIHWTEQLERDQTAPRLWPLRLQCFVICVQVNTFGRTTCVCWLIVRGKALPDSLVGSRSSMLVFQRDFFQSSEYQLGPWGLWRRISWSWWVKLTRNYLSHPPPPPPSAGDCLV